MRFALQREVQRLAHGILVAEVRAGHGLGDDKGIGRVQCGGRIALLEAKGEHLEEGCVDQQRAVFTLHLRGLSYHGKFVSDNKAHRLRHVGQFGFQRGSHWIGGHQAPSPRKVGPDGDQAVALFVEAVVGKLILHVQPNEQTTSHPYRQPQDVDGGVKRLPSPLTQRNFQIVFQHKRASCLLVMPGLLASHVGCWRSTAAHRSSRSGGPWTGSFP